MVMSIYDGAVPGGTLLQAANITNDAASHPITHTAVAVTTPATASKTYNVGVSTPAGTLNFQPNATSPAFVLVELV
jgi:hypothetical protein